jgi:hypothetical protein
VVTPRTLDALRLAVARVLVDGGLPYGVARVAVGPSGFGDMSATIRPRDTANPAHAWVDAGGIGPDDATACVNAWRSFLLVVKAERNRAAAAERVASEKLARAEAALAAALAVEASRE